MSRTFDASLQNILQSMLSVCLEFMVRRRNTAEVGADIFDERLPSLLECLLDDLDQLTELHEGNGREATTEMRLRYDVAPNNVSVSFSYERKFSNTETLLPLDLFDAWYGEVKSQRQHAAWTSRDRGQIPFRRKGI